MRRNRFNRNDWSDPQWQEHMKEHVERRQRFGSLFGIALALVGLIWMAKLIFHLPFDWLTEWPFILIVVGLLIGIKNGFRNSAWWILCLIGGANLVDDYFPQYNDYIWPLALILGGIAIALRPRNKNKYCKPGFQVNNSITADNSFNIDVTFGGRKEMITAKDFKGGSVNVAFGGCELNFMQADIEETAILDLKVSFGGVEIIVPSHWHIQNEINPSFGGVDDERSIQTAQGEVRKTLILKGSCAFGHIEIKSY